MIVVDFDPKTRVLTLTRDAESIALPENEATVLLSLALSALGVEHAPYNQGYATGYADGKLDGRRQTNREWHIRLDKERRERDAARLSERLAALN